MNLALDPAHLTCRAPDFIELPPPIDDTPAPSRDEWQRAAAIHIEGLPDDCRAQRIDEWLRLRCPDVAVEVIGGGGEDVAIEARTVVLPVRRGARHVVQFLGTTLWWFARWGFAETESTAHVLDVSWVEGEAAPSLLLR
jgi:hypothetical protein